MSCVLYYGMRTVPVHEHWGDTHLPSLVTTDNTTNTNNYNDNNTNNNTTNTNNYHDKANNNSVILITTTNYPCAGRSVHPPWSWKPKRPR